MTNSASDPEDAAGWLDVGRAALARNDPAGAAAAFARAVALAPASTRTRLEYGNVLVDQGRLRDACAQYRAALDVDPSDASLYYNLGIAHDELLESLESEAAYRAALRLRPELAEAHVNLAISLLKQGRYTEAWPEYEWRWHPRHPAGNSARLPKLSGPRWTGQDLAGKTLLLAPEQGLGDTLQFCRYSTHLKAMGARTVIVARHTLAPLLRRGRDIARVIALDERFRPDDYDFWTLPLSLPRLVGTTLASIPADVPYLTVEPDKLAAWSARLPQTRGVRRVGLVWSGSARHPNDARRSIPVAAFAAILDSPGIQFVSLQKDAPAADRAVLRERNVFDAADDLHDFSDTAALMQCLDLVITVDSSPAHLAGALARPVWILLPFNPDWRWLLGRTDSPWYPTARLFRQPAPGDWSSVLREVRASLATKGLLVNNLNI